MQETLPSATAKTLGKLSAKTLLPFVDFESSRTWPSMGARLRLRILLSLALGVLRRAIKYHHHD